VRRVRGHLRSVVEPAVALQSVPVRAGSGGETRSTDAGLPRLRRLVLRAEPEPQVLRRSMRLDRGEAGAEGVVRESGAPWWPASVGTGRRPRWHALRPLRPVDSAR